ncbi:RNA 2',3'-cyclic phosphodiesterase [Bordetella sp. 2513F-2]
MSSRPLPPPRLFFALWPDAATAARLHDWIRAAHAACGGRPMRIDTLHITLAFLGPADPARTAQLVQATRQQSIPPGEIPIVRYGVFPRPRIVWAGPAETGQPGLEALHDELWAWLAPLGWQRPAQPFRPHATLLRHADTAAPLPPPPGPVVWRYERYALVHSEPGGGARYRTLATSAPA